MLCAERNAITSGAFLDERQKSVVKNAKIRVAGVKTLFYGGFRDAEREIAASFPERSGVQALEELYERFDARPDEDPLAVVEVEKDAFSPAPSHRDYLGALMSLGVKRETVGDIIVSENGCKIAVTVGIAPFVAENLKKAGKSFLKTKIVPPSFARESAANRGIPDSFTVSSLRLDSVVKNAFRLSRDGAREAVERGAVFVNGLECAKPDKKIEAGDKVVLRGGGKIVVEDGSGFSKKGRTIVKIRKFK